MDDRKPSIVDKILDQKTTEFSSEQPPNIQRLAKLSGKSPNAVNVEYEKELRNIEHEQMKNPPAMTNSTDLQSLARVKAVDNLEKQYKTGQTEESDEVTYNDLVGDITNDFGQDPAADEFSMFAPGEQDMADQMFSDIDAINDANPYEEEPDTPALDAMDDLENIAEPDDGTVSMPNDSAEEPATEEPADEESPADDTESFDIPDVPE